MKFQQCEFDQGDFSPGIVDIGAVDGGKRQSLGGPGLRAFIGIADLWGLSEDERLVCLGSPSRSTFYGWASKVRGGGDISLSKDTLLRISGILGIYKALKIIFSHEADSLTWLKSSNQGLAFGGQSPLALILAGSQDGIIQVRRHLDAWRGGLFAAPVPGFDCAAPILTDSDVVVL